MAQIIRSPAAEADTVEIWAYIAQDNPPAADRLLAEFDRIFRMLATQPNAGKSIEELVANLRVIPTGNYLVFYRLIPEGIEIARILHGARDITAEFFTD